MPAVWLDSLTTFIICHCQLFLSLQSLNKVNRMILQKSGEILKNHSVGDADFNISLDVFLIFVKFTLKTAYCNANN